METKNWQTSAWRQDGPDRYVSESTFLIQTSYKCEIPLVEHQMALHNTLQWNRNGWVLTQFTSKDQELRSQGRFPYLFRCTIQDVPHDDPKLAQATASTAPFLTGQFRATTSTCYLEAGRLAAIRE